MSFLPAARLEARIDAALARSLGEAAERWTAEGRTRRLLERDATLWTGADEARWMGWLDAASDSLGRVPQLAAFAADVRDARFTHALLLGMGGSSMCPEVLSLVFGGAPGFPTLSVIDSTDPAQIVSVARRLELARTLVIVASKSGSTIEPNLLLDHFLAQMRAAVGPERAGSHFVAITDPGSSLEKRARAEGFRRVFHGEPMIGGRYSALSAFGMVPAAVLGLDLHRFLDAALRMRAACEAPDARANPGVALGIAMAVAARAGRDKMTLFASPRVAPIGAWIEQLVAESLGKAGVGVVPVDGEPAGAPTGYGADRLFVHLRVDEDAADGTDRAVDAIAAAGHPVLRITLADRHAIAGEFVRWSVATAVAGSLLAVNPFDQPDVEAAKVAARRLVDDFEASGRMPADTPLVRDARLSVFGPGGAGDAPATPQAAIAQLLDTLRAGDYLGLLAFIEMNRAHAAALDRIRVAVRDAKGVATTLGFGPRYLHSSGQMHKGGPDSGVFLVVTHDARPDLPVPGRKATFGVVELSQAQGDFRVLVERGRRTLRIHLGDDVAGGLAALEAAVAVALGGGGARG
jgi:transaldolase/glucose-6-phosphate isomerase